MNKAQKTETLTNLTRELSESKSATIVNYKGMTMTDMQALRTALSAVGGKLTVVKNTLLRLALKNTFDTFDTFNTFDTSALEGQIALIVAKDDEVAPLQALAEYLKGADKPVLKFGVFEDKLINTEDLNTLSKLPGKPTLYGQLVGSLSVPTYGLVGVLQGNLQKLVYILDAKVKMQTAK